MNPTPQKIPQAPQVSADQFQLIIDSAPVLIRIAGIDKRWTWFNRSWLDFVGRTMEQELGNGWAENVPPDDLEHCLHTYTTAFDARESFVMEYRLKRHDAQYQWVLDNGVPVYGANQEFTGYRSCLDFADRIQSEEKLADAVAGIRMLHDLGTRLIALHDQRTLIGEIIAAAVAITHADMGALHLV